MTVRSRPGIKSPPSNLRNPQALLNWLRTNSDAATAHRHGKMDVTKEFTLTAGAATSTLSDYRLSPQSCVLFDPQTANAATELYGGTMYALTANRGDGAWTIAHANNANADRTFTVLIIG